MTDWLHEYETALAKSQQTELCESAMARVIMIKEMIYARMVEEEKITRSDAMTKLNRLIWDKWDADEQAFKELQILKQR